MTDNSNASYPKPTQAEDEELRKMVDTWVAQAYVNGSMDGQVKPEDAQGYVACTEIIIEKLSALKSTWQAEALNELYHTITPISCKPDCTEVEHAYHRGSWDTIQNIEKAIDLIRERLEQ